MTWNKHASVLALLLITAVPMSATIQRTFVSSTGMDTNTCARDQPCRNFVAALAQTTAGGEVVVLDSAGYGAIPYITQAVSIISPLGVHAAITVSSGGDGITINAPTSSVVLRNIYLTALFGRYGINIQNASSVVIDRGFVTGFYQYGIAFGPTPTSADLMMSDSVIASNGQGVFIQGMNSSALAVATVVGSRIENSSNDGFVVNAYSRAFVRDSVAAGNGSAGFSVYGSGAGSNVMLDLERCVSYHNYFGAYLHAPAGGTDTIRVSNCSLTLNYSGVYSAIAGQILSRQNNTLEGNVSGLAFSGTYTAK